MSVPGKIMIHENAFGKYINNELKNIAQIEHSRHKSFANIITNALSDLIAPIAYFPKGGNLFLWSFIIDNHLTLLS